ncbi:MAG: CRISPR-associated endonuclease Cas2 [Candidatus Helarchaeota archaeon]
MLYLVTYDVPQEYPKLRNRIVNILKGWGLIRIQYSVFIGNLTKNNAEAVALQITSVAKGLPMDVRIFRICKNCIENSIIVSENPLIEKYDSVVF